MKLLITGGHMSPALAVVDAALSNQEYNHIELIFVGRKFVNEREKNVSMEAQEIEKRNVRFIDLKAGRLGSIISPHIFRTLRLTIRGFVDSLRIIKQEKPDVVLTFGSYIGFPIAVAARLYGIPVYVHEQTIRPGLTTQFVGQFATEVFIAFADSRGYFKKEKTIITGNPLRQQIFYTIKKPFVIQKNRPVIYITGGSMGSHSINELFETILSSLLEKYTVIHQTGNVAEFGDYERFVRLRSTLPPQLAAQYFVREHILTDEIGYVYSLADVVIGRSGANTFFELIALHKPAVLIPLPWSAHGEQQHHAEMFQDAGAGILFDQDDSPQNLLRCINLITDNLPKYQDNFKNLDEHYRHDSVNIILKSYKESTST